MLYQPVSNVGFRLIVPGLALGICTTLGWPGFLHHAISVSGGMTCWYWLIFWSIL